MKREFVNCGPRPSREVCDWTTGKTHKLPIFEDRNQARAALRMRKTSFLNAIVRGDGRAWPEWAYLVRLMGLPDLDLESILEKIPLPSYLSRGLPKGASRARRRKYVRAALNWFRPFGGEYRRFVTPIKYWMDNGLYDRVNFPN